MHGDDGIFHGNLMVIDVLFVAKYKDGEEKVNG